MLKTRDIGLSAAQGEKGFRLAALLIGITTFFAPLMPAIASESKIGRNGGGGRGDASSKSRSARGTVKNSPASFKLEAFEAFTNGRGVSLEWLTSGETDILGFNVYRETGSGGRELVNPAPVAGGVLKTSANLPAMGGHYRWSDSLPGFGAVYYLEAVDIRGDSAFYGPIAPSYKFLPDQPQVDSKTLSELTKSVEGSGQYEILNSVKSAGQRKILNREASYRRGKPKNSPTPTPTPAPTPTPSPTPTPAANAQWDIAALPGVKISVKRDGWYKVTAQELQNAGFNVYSNQANWQLYTDGVQQPLKVSADGSVEFFGRGIDTPTADTKIYYLIEGASAGLRVAQASNVVSNSASAGSYALTSVRKDRSIYYSTVKNGDAENWFGALVSNSAPTFQDLNISDFDPNGTARLSIKLQGVTSVQHSVNVKFNSFDLGNISYSNWNNQQFDFDVPASMLVQGTNRVSLQALSSGDHNLVDSISLDYRRFYKAQNDKLRFTVPAGKQAQIEGFSESNIRVFELQNGTVTREINAAVQYINGSYAFTLGAASVDREMLAVAESRKEQAAKVEQNQPSAWNSPANAADFVIIAPQVFAHYAHDLANRRMAQGLNTKVVFVEDVYDEFNFGARSPQAIRDFLKHAVSTWQIKPKYVLLFGDSSFDARNYLGQTNRDLIPTKLIDTEIMETASDTWFVDFNNDFIEDIPIGRLPVGSEPEAARIVAKLARYDQQQRTQASGVFVADHYFNSMNQSLRNILPASARGAVINRSEMTDAQMREEILKQANQNPTFVIYTGHGSTAAWTSGSVFTTASSSALTNSELSFYMIVGCMNGYTHNAYGDSLAEALLKADNAAVGVWASSGSIYASGPTVMSPVVTDKIFNSPSGTLRIGDIVVEAKKATSDKDTKVTYEFFGDPTLFVR